ncbi:MAG: hypothetical protein A2W25_04415 [candidate division Zixibacteria bacterium RBG_16_53_22]|nr:MAG: hypothetical protein A2W25_04415 [candidate division Zixibacteria bacterium RBG_16_53_22]
MRRIEKVAQRLEANGYQTQILDDNRLGVVVPHGGDRDVRNSIPMWMWLFYWIKTTTVHEHARGDRGNDIIEVMMW